MFAIMMAIARVAFVAYVIRMLFVLNEAAQDTYDYYHRSPVTIGEGGHAWRPSR